MPKDDLAGLAELVGNDWKTVPQYYNPAEADMENRWGSLIWPFIAGSCFSICLDLAAGHGRNTRKLLEQPECQRVYVVDINQENIDFCADRFRHDLRVVCIRNNGYAITEVPAGSVTMFYCFDAMVHFDSDIVRRYLAEIRRVLDPDVGRAFLHHSNFAGNPSGDVHQNPHWRNFMSAGLMSHYAAKEGLSVEKQQELDWANDRSFIDCITLLVRTP